MALLDDLGIGKSHGPDSLSDKLSREGSLMASVPTSAWDGLKARAEDAWDHKLRTGTELAGSFLVGASLAVASRNPEAVTAKIVPWVAGGMIGTDFAKRIGIPLVETWNDPSSLAKNKVRLGANLGAMGFDYAVMGTAGAAGAGFGPGIVDGLMGTSTGSAASGSEVSRALKSVARDPGSAAPLAKVSDAALLKGMPKLENLGSADMPAFKVNWPEGMSAADRLATSQKLTDAMFENNFATLTTTKSINLPFSSPAFAFAAASDIGRPRDNTRLGALTNITPMQANFHEAMQGMKLRTDKLFDNLDADRATIVDKSQNWLQELNKK